MTWLKKIPHYSSCDNENQTVMQGEYISPEIPILPWAFTIKTAAKRWWTDKDGNRN